MFHYPYQEGELPQLRELVQQKRDGEPYRSFAELSAQMPEGIAFDRVAVNRESAVAVVVPHGGNLEPGTSEMGRLIADNKLSLYSFESRLPEEDLRLHITSARFDDPLCVEIVVGSLLVLAVHGTLYEPEAIFVGGKATLQCRQLIEALRERDVPVYYDQLHPGAHSLNVCNRGRRAEGVQVEVSRGIRRHFSESPAAACFGSGGIAQRVIEAFRVTTFHWEQVLGHQNRLSCGAAQF